jgi:hypothetical protein
MRTFFVKIKRADNKNNNNINQNNNYNVPIMPCTDDLDMQALVEGEQESHVTLADAEDSDRRRDGEKDR